MSHPFALVGFQGRSVGGMSPHLHAVSRIAPVMLLVLASRVLFATFATPLITCCIRLLCLSFTGGLPSTLRARAHELRNIGAHPPARAAAHLSLNYCRMFRSIPRRWQSLAARCNTLLRGTMHMLCCAVHVLCYAVLVLRHAVLLLWRAVLVSDVQCFVALWCSPLAPDLRVLDLC